MTGAAFVAGCGDATAPSGQPTPTPTPTPTPAPPNTPPRITSVTASKPQIDANEPLTLTAVVTDAETPVDQLVYDWAVTPMHGSFTGTGRTVTWTAPQGQTTPDTYSFTVTVTENYTANGQPQKNTVTSTPVLVHYNDSVAEISRISLGFLTDFATFSVSPEQCVRNFTTTTPVCEQGKADELSDITGNRANFHILSANPLFINSLTIDPDTRLYSDIYLTCVFHDIPNNTGQKESVPGLCHLTALYVNWTWFLCESHFASTGPVTPESLRFRVPGQIRPGPVRLPQ